MTKKRKTLIILCLCFVLGLLALSGIGLYYYSNPSELKPLVEGALSRFTGTECSIKEISYSRHPLVIRAKGIQMIDHIQGFYLEIPEVFANLSLEGSFGRRSLIFRDLRVSALTLSMNQGWRPPEIIIDTERPPLLRRILGGLFSFLLFKDVRVHEAEMEGGHVTGQWGDLIINLSGISARLSPEQNLHIGCGARIQSHPGQVDLRIPRLTLATVRPVYPLDTGIQASVKGEEITFETPQGRMADASLEAGVLYSPQEETVDFESLKISFDGISLNEGRGTRSVPLRSLVEAGGRLDLHKASLAFPSLRVVLGNVVEFKGEFRADLQESEGFSFKVTDLKAVPQNLIPLLPNPLKRKLDPFTFTGSILASGRLDGNIRQDFRHWVCDLRARLRENKMTFSGPAIHFETRVTGDIQAKGALSGPDTLLTANCDDSALQARNIQFDRGTIRVSLRGTYPTFDLKALDIHLPGAKWEVGEKEILLEEIQGQASSGRLDVVAKALQLPELILHTSILKDLSIATVITQEQLSITARGKDIHLVEFVQAMRFIPPGWKIRSTDSLHAQAVFGGDGNLTLTSKVEMGGLSFESPDGRCLGEKLSLVLEPTLEWSLAKQAALNGSVFLYVREGEVLFDRFYLDLSQHNLTSNGKGHYVPDLSSVELSDFRLQLGDLATLTAHGTLSSGKSEDSEFRVHFSKTPLSPLFRQFVVEPYKHQNAFLDDLQLNGFFSADLEVNEQDALRTVKGHAFWHEGDALLEGEGIVLKGIDMDFPFWYQVATKSTEEKRNARKTPVEIKGDLSIRSAQLPLLPEQPIDMQLKAAPDRLSTTSPLSLKVSGGQVDLGRIVLRNPFSGSPELDTRLTIKRVDLAPWLSRIWPEPVQGSALGKLDPVRLEGGILRTMGRIDATVFGGQITISNVGLKRSLSLAPVIQLDAEWEDLTLAEMTQGTSFGKIEGILQGHVKGLEISNGQPQKFDLFMETVKRKDVPQKISMQAVDNIARIGGGASPFSGLTGAFVTLFKELPYEKIGVKASLENDVFRINGTVKEEGREYLVKKGSFSGVDVIIGGAGSNTISFKDMVNRIRRVTASQEGPVVE